MNDIEKYSTHDFHIDPISNHSYYELNKGFTNATAMSANTGSEYEKYTWLEQMMKNKSNIIVTNSNTNYYKISQPEKDKKMVKIEDAPDGVVTSSTPGIYTGKQGFQVIPNWAANPDAKQTAIYLFR